MEENANVLPQVTTRRKVFGLITVLATVLFLAIGISVYQLEPHIPLICGAIVATILAVIDGSKYEDIEKGMVDAIGMGMQAILILLVIGALISSWIMGGIIQSLVYYGLMIIEPEFFLLSALIICSIVSISTGTSWATAGTVGVVLMAIAAALDVPLPMAAGAVVSGAYFGDKMSPLSDTTNLSAAVSGANLFDHIKSMLWTTVPVYILCIILYIILGIFFVNSSAENITQIDQIQGALSASANVSIWTLLAPAMVFIIVIFKIPALPGLLAAMALGIPFAIFFQGITNIGEIADVIQNGYTYDGSTLKQGAEAAQHFFTEHQLITEGNYYEGMTYFTGLPADGSDIESVVNEPALKTLPFDHQTLMQVQDLLTRGGIMSMMNTVALIICAMCFGGALEASGMLVSLVEGLRPLTKTTGSLVTVSILSGFAINALASDQYVAVILPGRMFKGSFVANDLAPRYQSRVIESSGAVTSALIPWNTCGATMTGFLGVGSFAYAPFAFFNTLTPIFEIIGSFVGYKVFKRSDDIKAGLIKENN